MVGGRCLSLVVRRRLPSADCRLSGGAVVVVSSGCRVLVVDWSDCRSLFPLSVPTSAQNTVSRCY